MSAILTDDHDRQRYLPKADTSPLGFHIREGLLRLSNLLHLMKGHKF